MAVSGTGLNTTPNSPQAPVKSRCQIAWPGIARQRRVQHAQHLGPLLEPARHLESGLMMAREPHAERAQAAHRHVHVVGADAEPEWRTPFP